MLVPCTVDSVRVHVLTGQHVVLLQERDAKRLLPIWIGQDQAHSIATRVAGIRSERPLTHDLMMEAIRRLGAQVSRVVVKDLVADDAGGGVFHGSVFLESGGTEIEIDSRASDAIALAVRCDAPIFVAESVLDRTGIANESGDEEGLSVFRAFIETLPDEPGGPA